MNVDDFKAKLIGGGNRPNLFKVICNFPSVAGGKTELAAFMIKGASLPSDNLGTIEVPFMGRKLKLPGDRTFESWNITIINDGKMEIRNAFERWMNFINAHRNNLGALNPTSYMADMEVHQLDRQGKAVKKYKFVGAWPSMVGSVDLNFETNDTVEEFPVELQYQYWESNTTS